MKNYIDWRLEYVFINSIKVMCNLLIDLVTANIISFENKDAIARLISDLHDKGKIIIMITHDKDIMNKLNNVKTIYLERKVANK